MFQHLAHFIHLSGYEAMPVKTCPALSATQTAEVETLFIQD